ncbi:hypothetical protein B0A49_08139 [Cryomyces minteri]|uniref:DUF1275 domain protein n=1 Tax=Cryomyces minteri TaxID=331657 RepID=A0A4U0WJ60_9PEZI|nr:hypothetical protein B0A49_08139 [Cryomyces minteri]
MRASFSAPSQVVPPPSPTLARGTQLDRPLRKRNLSSFLTRNVCEDALLESELLLLAFATGIQDGTTYPDFLCFASNQTGNSVLLAVGLTRLGGVPINLSNVGVSLSLFIAGGWIMGQLGNAFGCRRRLWLLVSSLLQTAMVFAAAGIIYRLGVAETGPVALGVIALLAFSSGDQVAMARSLKIMEITTAMATAAYIDLLIDPELFKARNRPRNRRVLFLISLVAGSFAGAFAYARA